MELVSSTFTSTSTGADGSRSCLPNAVMNVMFNESKSESLLRHLLSNKPTKTLCDHGLDLKLVTPNYCKGGDLMREEACRLVLAIKLHNSKDVSWGHFVAWDGNIIHDNPHSCKVELKSDRTKRGIKATFRKLFPQK